MEEVPILHHKNCENADCKVCLADHIALGGYLQRACGYKTGSIDFLGRYRGFMDKRLGRSSETEHGWGDPAIFKTSHIDAFVKWWTDAG